MRRAESAFAKKTRDGSRQWIESSQNHVKRCAKVQGNVRGEAKE